MARVEGITRDVALTAAKIEAHILDSYKTSEDKSHDSKRRKWDCFHIATALALRCSTLYSFDKGMLNKRDSLGLKPIRFLEPGPLNPNLFENYEEEKSEGADDAKGRSDT